jgi:hypothetical protein
VSGHGSLLPAPVCACDLHPARCPCECYGCRARALDAKMREDLGAAYGPLKALARVLGWVRR